MATHIITGGSGFLGRHVGRHLAERGQRVILVDIAPPPATAFVSMDGRTLDLTSASDAELDAILADADVVHHYAWSTIPQTANADPLADLRDNVGTTLRLFEAVRRRGSGVVVFASSGGTVYGPHAAVPTGENQPLDPITAYGAAKIAAEKYLGVFRALHGVDARIARLSNPFGAGQNPHRPQGAATHFVHRALSGQPIEIWGDGTVVRDFIHVADAVAGLVALAEAPLSHERATPVVNIGSGVGTSLNEIVAAIEARLGRRIAVTRGSARAFDVPVSILDISHARDMLGWSPRLSFAEGIDRMITDLASDPHRQFSTLHAPPGSDAAVPVRPPL